MRIEINFINLYVIVIVMVLDKLGNSLRDTINKIKNSVTVDRTVVEEIVKEIQKALLASDVNVRLVLDLTKKIRDRAITENIAQMNKRDHLITIIFEELSHFLGDERDFRLIEGKQNRIMLVGLYGQGKTTTAGKLGLYFKNRSKKVCLISTDTWRPAAYEQLKQTGEKLSIDVYGDPNEKNPDIIFLKYEKAMTKYDVVIVDSAGRDSLNDELVEEISILNKIVMPTDTLMVLGADVGQSAQRQAEMFKDKLHITGVIITKMDGTGKGGGALSACSIVEAPVRFIGVGERSEDLERFNSQRFVSQLLGMGDIESLLEKAKIAMDEKKAKNMQDKLMTGEFDLDDLYEQLKAMNKMGSMSKLMGMIPGLGGLNIDKSMMQVQEEKITKWKYIMDSMTLEEKKKPDVLDISRVKRISTGSGTDVSDVRDLLKQYKQMKKMFSMFKDPSAVEDFNPEDMQNNPQEMMKMMKKFGGNKMMKQMMKKNRR